jgi:L-alanine-DL-glutamate epimerase-like enolase superfamily enzyme
MVESTILMSRPTDVRVTAAAAYFLPVTFRVPLKFGPEVTTSVVCLRARVRVENASGLSAEGWGETPLSVSWTWPGTVTVAERARRMEEFALRLAESLSRFDGKGHPMEIGHDFQKQVLIPELEAANNTSGSAPMPYLAALVCLSAFDIAIHDAFGNLLNKDIYATYIAEFMTRDLSHYIEGEEGSAVDFKGRFPADFLATSSPAELPVWHLVGGLDALESADLTGSEPQDGYPLLLGDWIHQDGLKCLKVKLRGTDAQWDYERLLRVGSIGLANGMRWMSADFNCTVREPDYVNSILDRLLAEAPDIYARTLYVEQPFAYELEHDMLDVRSVSARKPLFLDESAHDWEFVRLGRRLGWSGVALKTCKTQTGALLSLCWAKAHGMPLMVQDLTNPMLAMIPHVRLAAFAGTIQGVECNAMQFYPDASLPEEKVHPGLYRRRNGIVDLRSFGGSGFGYRIAEIQRGLPDAAGVFGNF